MMSVIQMQMMMMMMMDYANDANCDDSMSCPEVTRSINFVSKERVGKHTKGPRESRSCDNAVAVTGTIS